MQINIYLHYMEDNGHLSFSAPVLLFYQFVVIGCQVLVFFKIME